MKVMTVFGTRPEAIKMAPVVQSLLAHSEIETKVCLTAQHREMLDQVVDLFKLPVDYDLDIMRSGQSLYDITSRVLRGLEEVLEKEKPDYVLVHGDTTTTFTASGGANLTKKAISAPTAWICSSAGGKRGFAPLKNTGSMPILRSS